MLRWFDWYEEGRKQKRMKKGTSFHYICATMLYALRRSSGVRAQRLDDQLGQGQEQEQEGDCDREAKTDKTGIVIELDGT